MLGAGGRVCCRIRVIEIADELENTGLRAGLGAEVIKVEPAARASTRRIGPFEDKMDAERSLFFWAYNRGNARSCSTFRIERSLATGKPARTADVLLDAGGRRRKNSASMLGRCNRAIRHDRRGVRPSAYRPWKDFKGPSRPSRSAGEMMTCGYDPDPSCITTRRRSRPKRHAYHIAGEQLAVRIVAASCIENVREGQVVSCGAQAREEYERRDDVGLPPRSALAPDLRHASNRQTIRRR